MGRAAVVIGGPVGRAAVAIGASGKDCTNDSCQWAGLQ